MKVILLKDVARIGRRFEVTDVPIGHAQNFLIPQRLAEPATSANLKRLEAQRTKADAQQTEVQEIFHTTCKKLADTSVTLAVEANEKGHLFKAIKAEEIAMAVSEQVGTLTTEQIVLDQAIKAVGEYTISVVCGDESATLTLVVVAK